MFPYINMFPKPPECAPFPMLAPVPMSAQRVPPRGHPCAHQPASQPTTATYQSLIPVPTSLQGNGALVRHWHLQVGTQCLGFP